MSLFGGGLYTDPFSDLLDMQRRMDRLLNRFGTGTEADVPLLTGGGVGSQNLPLTTTGTGVGQLAQWNPRMDIRETNKGLEVHAELPGCNKEDIKLHIDHDTNRLVLQGDKKAKKREQGENWVRKERFEGSFYRAIPLPPGCDFSNIKANFNNGVLEVCIPKPKDVGKTQGIDIQVGERAGTTGTDFGAGRAGVSDLSSGGAALSGTAGTTPSSLTSDLGGGAGFTGAGTTTGLQEGQQLGKEIPIQTTSGFSQPDQMRPEMQTRSTAV